MSQLLLVDVEIYLFKFTVLAACANECKDAQTRGMRIGYSIGALPQDTRREPERNCVSNRDLNKITLKFKCLNLRSKFNGENASINTAVTNLQFFPRLSATSNARIK